MKKIIIKVLAGSICVGAVGYLMWGFQPNVNIVNEQADSNPASTRSEVLVVNAQSLNPINDIQAFIDSLSVKMKHQHAHEISSVLVQLSLADFKKFVLEQFPSKGESVFEQIIRSAFPEYADSIFALLDNMQLYNDWHVDMLLTLNEMNPLARNGTLWEKRHDLFGDLAEEIWQQELDDEQNKQKSVQETLAALHQANNISMEDRLNILTENINQLYGDEHDALLISKGMVANIYFTLDSVQNDLKRMSETDRENALAASRRQLGFSEKNIKEMAELDKQQEVRWKNGYQYMSSRDQMMSLYSGEELNNKLNDLRQKHFKHEAATIEKEEMSDFYRYNRPRLYGSN